MAAYFSGLFISLSLIMAIGAQNAFVLRQGIKKQHVFIVCAICAGSDAILIFAGVTGFALLLQTTPWLETAARYGGAVFLVIYGLRSLYSAWRGSAGLAPGQGESLSVWPTVATCLAFTWLNPHVYLDTVVFIGSISTQFAHAKWSFTFGAMSASFIFFFSLGYSGRLLIPLFQRPVAWRVLDLLVALLMFTLAASFIIA